VLIVVKYLFQFNFYPWNNPNSPLAKELARNLLNPLVVFGIEKKDTYAAFDLFLLFSLFIHRSILKVNGNNNCVVKVLDKLCQ
jgi:piezo-type mechanosensitive ion channel component 1/2